MQAELIYFKNSLWANFKDYSLFDFEKMLSTKNYPQIRGAKKILKDVIACKLISLQDRNWC